MKFNTVLVGLLVSGVNQVSGFPSHLSEAMIQIKRTAEAKANADALECPFAKAKRQSVGITPPFDAEQQYVSTNGEHAFVAPSGNDQRGPCKWDGA
jgi:hypothetical protein